MMRKPFQGYAELLRAGRWFRGIPAPFQEALLAMSHVRRVSAHEILFSRGALATEMFAVLEGKLRVSSRDTPESREVVITLVEPPSWVGELGLFDDVPRSLDLSAQVDSVVLHVPRAPLHALLEAEPRYWQDFGKLLTAKLRLAFLGMADAATSTVEERVSRRLAMMVDGYGEWADRTYPVVKVTQETLATMVASSRQSVNGALRALEAAGLVKISYGGIEVLDVERLRRALLSDKGALARPAPAAAPSSTRRIPAGR
jgi:CRP/FNR family transcriptional regulator, cyclic AMP receptor protein